MRNRRRAALGRTGRPCGARRRRNRLVPREGHRGQHLLHQLLHQLRLPAALLPSLQEVAEAEDHKEHDADQNGNAGKEQEHVLMNDGGGAGGRFHLEAEPSVRVGFSARALSGPTECRQHQKILKSLKSSGTR